jgi:hypothetical protein
LRFPARVVPFSVVGVVVVVVVGGGEGGGGEGRVEASITFCRLFALMKRGLTGSGVRSGNLEEGLLSESEAHGRFLDDILGNSPNLGERRGDVVRLGVVRRWTAICSERNR